MRDVLLAAIIADDKNSVTSEGIAKALVPSLIAALPVEFDRYTTEEIEAIARAVNDETARRFGQQ